MARDTGSKENFRVVVLPLRPWLSKPDDKAIREQRMMDACREIADAVKRHVDDVYSVDIEYDTRYSCEHCGFVWTEDSHEYNGGCCRMDQEAQDAREADSAATGGEVGK